MCVVFVYVSVMRVIHQCVERLYVIYIYEYIKRVHICIHLFGPSGYDLNRSCVAATFEMRAGPQREKALPQPSRRRLRVLSSGCRPIAAKLFALGAIVGTRAVRDSCFVTPSLAAGAHLGGVTYDTLAREWRCKWLRAQLALS